MIKLLIVDDEEEIRSGIRDIIDWQAHAIGICGEAGNGIEALRAVRENAPDIMLLDVKMPEMDGIQVMETLSRAGSDIKVVIMSGHDSFSYAQKALKLGAVDYLLKPCHKDTILQTVLGVKETVTNERKNRQILEQLQTQFHHSLPLLKEKYLIKLLNAESEAASKAVESFALFEIGMQPANILVAVVSIDSPYQFHGPNHPPKDLELMKLGIRNIAREVIGREGGAAAFPETVEYNENIIVFFNTEPGQTERAVPLLEAVKNEIRNSLNFSVTIGLGNVASETGKVHLSYFEALKSLEAKFFLGTDQVIPYEEIRLGEIGAALYPLQEEKAVLSCIIREDEARLPEEIAAFFKALDAAGRSKNSFKSCSLALYLSVFHLWIERDLHAGELLQQSFARFDVMMQLETLVEIKTALLDAARFVSARINRKSGNRSITAAVKYIEDNYAKDINLESAAGNVYLSPSYFSLLFKQVTGVNFVDYLNHVRVKKACELLQDIKYKTYEVAYQTGFHDEKYFSYIFKKITGMSPSQYRMK